MGSTGKIVASLVVLFLVSSFLWAQEKSPKSEATQQKEEATPKAKEGEAREGEVDVRQLLRQIEEDMKEVSTLFTRIRVSGEEKEKAPESEVLEVFRNAELTQQRIIETIEEVIQFSLSQARRRGQGGRRPRQREENQSDQDQARREQEERNGLHRGRREDEMENNGNVDEKGKQDSGKKPRKDPTGPGTGENRYGDWGKLPRRVMEEFQNIPRGVNLRKIPPEYLEKLNEYSKKLSESEKK